MRALKTMLSLTKKTEYALLSLSHLSRPAGGLCSAREISDAYQLPLPVLMNVLKRLAKIGLIESTRGARGGYSLVADPGKIILGDLIRAMEGEIHLVQCADEASENRCEIVNHCPIQGPLIRLQHRLEGLLAGLSLADVIGPEPGQTPLTQCTEECVRNNNNETSVSG